MLSPGQALLRPLRDLESRNLHWISPSSLLEEAAVLMIYRRARHLPVGSGGVASYMISIRDVARAMLGHDASWRALRVSEVAATPPVSLEAGSTVSDAVKLMAKRYLGSVLVTSNGAVEGIVTERDLVRLVAEITTHRRVYDAMTLDPRVVDLSTTARGALSIMISGSFRHLPVASGGSVVGITSMRDVVSRIAEGRMGLGDPLRSAVTYDPLTIDPSASSEDAARLMSSREVGSLLVMDAGRLVGIVTERDLVLRVLAKLVS
ncbi:MAG TPA: CBS domain-containing protein [Nitrososphaeria archaeon]|jgi:CBS domain-containing protein|nr:CBS domain-containing protein [Conexivisphaerales archaeon]HEU16793.1 CBS domain-containing protein [Nitrososphaeria archaeon]